MTIIEKLGSILLITLIVYLWNKFITPFVINRVVTFHNNHNSKNLGRQPIKFVVQNEASIIKIISISYWLAATLIIFGIIKDF